MESNQLATNVRINSSKRKKSLDDVENTIFVGNLPNTTNIKELKKLFRKFGIIVSARLRCVIRKELKTPKKVAVIKKEFHEDSGHINAYIKFQTFESCKAALKLNGSLHQNHHLRVNLASDDGKTDPRRSIFLGNLPFKVQDDDLWEVFEDCGTIEHVRVVRDEQTGIGKGFGYINFKSADSVELALQLDGVTILDRNIRVSRVINDRKKLSANPKQKSIKGLRTGNKIKEERKYSIIKVPENNKMKNEFQGQKTKPSIHKKNKKKKKLDKKKMAVKRIAEDMSKKDHQSRNM